MGAGAAGRILAVLTTIVVVTLLGWWTWIAAARVNPGPGALAWTVAAVAVVIGVAITERFERAIGLLLVGSAFIPVATSKRNLRSAFVMVGVPWLAYFVTRALPLVGHVTAYSWDDWLAYQIAGARIYMHGFWLEGGSSTFDYQPLYRWISGALHVGFGDSSVGETYVDAACLLAGSLLAFSLVRPVGGFRAALLATTGTLATFTLGTPWYFVGRGLSETAAAGFAFAAAFLLMRAKLGHRTFAAAAGVLAVLMFYTRLNHLLFAVSLLALLLPLSTSMRPSALAGGARLVRFGPAATYGAVFAAGVALFAARTWWYTGVFSLVYGTSLKNNDTGLRLSTIASIEPWQKVAHSLGGLVWLNEPPRPDARAVVMMLGAQVLIAAVLQLPTARRLPATLVIVAAGSSAAAFLAHAHGYPGRFSLLSVPFASALGVLWLAGLRRAEVRP